MNRLIINADDFGKSEDINVAIMSAMNLNLCLDTTLLVNFEASAHAAGIAISNKKKHNVGIHLNLTEGFPLTNRIKNENRFCNRDGLFQYKKNKRIIHLSASERRAVYEELTSQIQLCRNLGIPISHADSHNHIHEEPGMLLILLSILKKENIPFLRIAKNIGRTSLINSTYRKVYNSILSFNNLTATKYFGSISDFNNSTSQIKKDSIVEIMIHPGSIINSEIFDLYSKDNLTVQLSKILTNNKLISYDQIMQINNR